MKPKAPAGQKTPPKSLIFPDIHKTLFQNQFSIKNIVAGFYSEIVNSGGLV